MSVNTVRDAAVAVARLDRTADWASSYETTQLIDGHQWSGADIVGAVIEHVRFAVAAYAGRGSNAAAHALKNVSTGEVRSMLVAWGASPFTVEQYARTIARYARSGYFSGGADHRRYVAHRGGLSTA